MKPFRQLERITKGIANHRRIEIITLLEKSPELSVIEIAQRLKVNFKTVAEHIQRLTRAGLVMKRNDANAVRHALTSLGKSILKFLRTLE